MSNEIAEYNEVTAGLETLKTRMKDVVYDVTTTKGMAEAKGDRLQIVRLRTSLEAKRKEIKSPALAHCKLIDEEARRITAELVALETPIDGQIKAEEARKDAERQAKALAEQQRVAEIMEMVAAVKSHPETCRGMVSTEIEQYLNGLIGTPIEVDQFQEFVQMGQAAKDESISRLKVMLLSAISSEQEAARIAEEKASREAQEEVPRS